MKQSKSVYSFIALDDFKALLGIDDREEPLARFCLTIAAHTIEQHCMRRLLRKKHFEHIRYLEDLLLIQVFSHADCFSVFIVKLGIGDEAVFFVEGKNAFVVFNVGVNGQKTGGAIS